MSTLHAEDVRTYVNLYVRYCYKRVNQAYYKPVPDVVTYLRTLDRLNIQQYISTISLWLEK